MKLMTAAGIKANPIDTTNTIKIPLAVAPLSLNLYVTGNETVVTLYLKSGFPVAYLRMASYKK